ncbi:MAG: NUDIX hydrolase [Anaerolineae bacterium]|nr:NUDIX hydrolase [Anaerolineae bacterium]
MKLFDVYPELKQAIDRLCKGIPWRITGASALVYDAENFYFELAKPKHWHQHPDGTLEVGIGAIGGSIETGESILGCLQREATEELGKSLQIASAERTYLVFKENTILSLELAPRSLPRPALFTIGENLYRQHLFPEYPLLAIATFFGQLQGPPQVKDLFALFAIPKAELYTLLQNDTLSLTAAFKIPGLSIKSHRPLPEKAILVPRWTVRTLQILLQAGYLTDLN